MDEKDRQIIRALQRNGRMTNQDLAHEVNLSASPCLRRLRNLEQTGAIVGYSAKVNAKLYGLAITVFVRVRLDRHNEEGTNLFESRVKEIDEILECHVLAGTMDYQLRVLVPSLEAYEEFIRQRIHTISSVASIDTTFAYGTVKQTDVFPSVE